MYNFLNQLAMSFSMIGRTWDIPDIPGKFASGKFAGSFAFLNTIFTMIDWVLFPLLALVAAAGAIYSVVLGVNLARAEDPEKRTEAKKRLVWAVAGIASIIVLIIVMNFVSDQIPTWINIDGK